MEKKQSWGIRATHEAQMHTENSFLTLTYDDKHLAKNTVDVRHWQLFAKKLRNEMGPFRFLHCGEYGEKNKRAHYHAVIFGHDFHRDRVYLKTHKGNPLWTSPTLQKLWEHGFSTIGSVTFDSSAYVAGYCVKKLTGQRAREEYERLDKKTGELWEAKPPYATMSRNPGLGNSWYKKFHDDVYPDDFVVIKGVKFRPPAYYDSMLEKEDPHLWASIQEKRKKVVRDNPDYQQEARLKAKEDVLRAKTNIYSPRPL